MKKSEIDIIKEWVEHTGTESAPDGFRQKVMSQIEIESTFAYVNPIKNGFIYVFIIVFFGLVFLALTLPSASEYPLIQNLIVRTSGLLAEFKASVPFPNLQVILRYLGYLAAGTSIFIVIDRILANHFSAGQDQSR